MKAMELLSEFAELFCNDVRQYCEIDFEENLVLASGCDNYGCTCISYEKCCGCVFQ